MSITRPLLRPLLGKLVGGLTNPEGIITGPTMFKPQRAIVEWEAPTKLLVRLTQEAAIGSDVVTGVTIEVDDVADAGAPATGSLQPDRRWITYTLTAAANEGEKIEFIYDSGTGTIVNDDAEALESGTVIATVEKSPPVFSGPVGDYTFKLNEAGSKDYSIYFSGNDLTYAINGVPTGMTFSTVTGVLSGTPTVDAEVTAGVVVTATNVAGSDQTDAHSITIVDIVTYLDATFHRYGPAGPLALNGADVLDDTGTADAQIDKGSLTLIKSGGTWLLQNEELEITAGAGQNEGFHNTGGVGYTRVVGLTIEADYNEVSAAAFNYVCGWVDTPNITDMRNASGYRLVGYYPNSSANVIDINGRAAEGTLVSLPYDDLELEGYKKYTIIAADYDAGGQPGEGSEGWLILLDGVPVFSHDADADTPLYPVFASMQAHGVGTKLDSFKVFIDPTPLATPHRSLFASDHADIADYMPEDGPAFTIVENMETTGGKARAASTVSDDFAEIDLPDPAKYIEASLDIGAAVGMGIVFRSTRGADIAGDWWLFRNNGILQEWVGGAPSERASVTTLSGNGRLIVSDDGENITVINALDGAADVAVSTVGNAKTRCGMYHHRNAGAGGFDWFCTRGGSQSAPFFFGTVADYSVSTAGENTHDYSVYFNGSPESYSINQTPSGMSFDTGTGILSGTPDTEGDLTNVVVTATNAAGSAQTNGHTITVAAIQVLLDATFHRQDPGPLSVASGQFLASADHADFGSAVGEIDKGKLLHQWFSEGGDAIVQDGRWTYANSGSSTRPSTRMGDVVAKQAGLTIETDWKFTAAFYYPVPVRFSQNTSPWDTAPYIYYEIQDSNQNDGGVVYKSRGDGGVLPELDINGLVPLASEGPSGAVFKLVYGGYNDSGEPDPAGAYGHVCLIDGEMINSDPMYWANSSIYVGLAGSGQFREMNQYDSVKVFIDPAPLATPNRSLFNGAFESVDDYIPEDGPGFVDESLLGKSYRVIDGELDPVLTQRCWALIDNGPVQYLETLCYNSSPTIAFRVNDVSGADSAAQGWYAGDQWNAATITINENAGVGWLQRASEPFTRSGDMRFILTDDGTNITLIEAITGTVATHPSTAGAAWTKHGLSSYDPAARFKWFCTRGAQSAPFFFGPISDRAFTQNNESILDYGKYFNGTGVSYSINQVPSGMSFDTATGILSGTPDVVETLSNVVVTATNSAGSANSTSHSLTVEANTLPSEISGLILWLKNTGPFWQDTGGLTPAEYGDPVGRWDDSSGSNDNFTQGTEASKGIRGTDNGVISGADDDMNGTVDWSAGGLNLTEGEIFYIVKAEFRGGAHNGFHNFGANNASAHPYGDGTLYNNFGSNPRAMNGVAVSTNVHKKHIVNCWSVVNDWAMWIDGTEEAYTTATNTVGFPSTNQLFISGGIRYAGETIEIVAFNRKLNTSERNQVLDYLRTV